MCYQATTAVLSLFLFSFETYMYKLLQYPLWSPIKVLLHYRPESFHY